MKTRYPPSNTKIRLRCSVRRKFELQMTTKPRVFRFPVQGNPYCSGLPPVRALGFRRKSPVRNSPQTTKLRAAFIRLYARHDQGSAVRETLDKLTDEQLIALDDRETAAKIARIAERNRKKN